MDEDFSRRGFMRAAGGAATAAAAASAGAAGTASAQERPVFPGYLDDISNEEFEDLRGQSEVTIEVGAGSSQFQFAPGRVWIDPGTTVTFEWVGDLAHNVVPESQPDGAGWEGYETLEGGGFTYEHTFETEGVYAYFCEPHEGNGMKGGIAVGEVETQGDGGGGGGGTQVPDWPGYLDDISNETFEDLRGESEVTIEVGAGSSQFQFAPGRIWIDPGTTITWEWIGDLAHNVVTESQPDGAGWEGSESLEGSGFTYEHTFETDGIYTYFCSPHEGNGMKGGIAVGEVPTVSQGGGGGGGGGGGPVLPEEAMTLVIATMAAMGTTLALAFAFLKYGGNRTPGAKQ
jgi:halocyanin-like protein